MKKSNYIVVIGSITLVLSVILIAYSITGIVRDNNMIGQSLQRWESDKKELLPAVQRQEEVETLLKEEMSVGANKDTSPPKVKTNKKEVQVFGKLILSATKDTIPIIYGTQSEDLRQGAGYYTKSPLPGEKGNCLLFGHRDTVFKNLASLKYGDKIILETAKETFTYKIIESKIVDAIDQSIFDSLDYAQLTLITCYPIRFVGPAKQRYLVIAELE